MDDEITVQRVYTDQSDPYKLIAARVPYWHIRMAKKLGKGNVSEGIRIALEHMSHEVKNRGVKECKNWNDSDKQ